MLKHALKHVEVVQPRLHVSKLVWQVLLHWRHSGEGPVPEQVVITPSQVTLLLVEEQDVPVHETDSPESQATETLQLLEEFRPRASVATSSADAGVSTPHAAPKMTTEETSSPINERRTASIIGVLLIQLKNRKSGSCNRVSKVRCLFKNSRLGRAKLVSRIRGMGALLRGREVCPSSGAENGTRRDGTGRHNEPK